MTSDLQLIEERYALAIEGTDDGLWDWDLKNNKIFYSNRWKSMLGYNDPEAIGDSPKEWLERLHPDDIEKFQFSVKSYLKERSNHFKAEYRIRHEQGHYLWMLCRGRAVWNKAGKPIRFIGFQTDITIKKNREQQLFHDAFHDPLTGLFNRALFMDRLNQALHSRTPFAVLYMDMDRFKQINDTLGHKVGDELLSLTARRLEECSRAGDTLARFGGDEFTLLLNNIINVKEVENIAKRIIKEISNTFTVERKEIHTDITIGIALSEPSNFKHPEQVIRNADIALYQAKDKRKGGYEVFDQRMDRLAVSRLKLEADLNRDSLNGKILFYYQPIIDLNTGRVVGLEALLRWEHEQDGVLKPTDFLSLAEETQLLVKLEKTAFNLALNQLEKLHDHLKDEKFFISFNISQQHLEENNFAINLIKILHIFSIHPSYIHLEFSESILINNPDRIDKILSELKRIGFKLCLDGFGTGYSSLAYLHRYPFDFVKIDHTFIPEIEKNPKKAIFAKNIIQVAKSLGMSVIAEGVETEGILKRLRNFHCPYGQGFYFSKPLPFEEIIDLL